MSSIGIHRFFPAEMPPGGQGPRPAGDPGGDTFLSHYMELARQNAGAILAVTLVCAALAGGMAYARLVGAPMFQASAKITVQPSDAELNFSRDFVRSSSFDSVNVLTQSQMEYLLSRDTLRLVHDKLAAAGGPPVAEAPGPLKAAVTWVRQTVKRLNMGRFAQPDPEASVLGALQDSITLNMIESSFIMQILVTWPDPDQAALIANTLAEVYRDRRASEASASGAELAGYLEDLRAEVRGDIDRLLTERGALRAQYNVLDLTSERDALLARISQAQADRDATWASLQALGTVLESYPVDDAALRSRRGGFSAEVRDTLALERIRQVELSELLSARDDGIEVLRGRLADLSAAEVPLGRVEEELSAARQRLSDVEQRIVDAGFASAGAIDALRIIDRAAPPLYPAAPGALKSAAGGGVAGLLLALMAIFGRDLRESRLRTRADLREIADARILDDIRLGAGAGSDIVLRDRSLLDWMGLQHGGELLLIDAHARERTAALAFALSDGLGRSGPALRVHDLASLHRAEGAARATAVLLTLPRKRIDRADLVERLAALRQQLPGVRLAIAFLDVPEACLRQVETRVRAQRPARSRRQVSQDAPLAAIAPAARPRRYRIKTDRRAAGGPERV